MLGFLPRRMIRSLILSVRLLILRGSPSIGVRGNTGRPPSAVIRAVLGGGSCSLYSGANSDCGGLWVSRPLSDRGQPRPPAGRLDGLSLWSLPGTLGPLRGQAPRSCLLRSAVTFPRHAGGGPNSYSGSVADTAGPSAGAPDGSARNVRFDASSISSEKIHAHTAYTRLLWSGCSIL